VQLKPTPFSNFVLLCEAYDSPAVIRGVLREKEPDVQMLFNRIFVQPALSVWELYVDGSTDIVGYASLFRSNMTDPNIYVQFVAAPFDPELFRDAVLAVAHAAFGLPNVNHLDYYFSLDQEDELRGNLVELGFDPYDGVTNFVDSSCEGLLCLYRYTYDAYHGGQAPK
jgi:hypothetical protein